MEAGAAATDIHCDVGMPCMVIQEVTLDRPAQMAGAKNEFVETEARIVAHDMDEYRFIANHRHRLWNRAPCHVTEPGAFAAAEEDNLHATYPAEIEKRVSMEVRDS